MKDKVEFDVMYPESPPVVWKAITDPTALSEWLLSGDFQPLIGFRFRLDRAGAEPIKGKVLEVEAEKLLAYTWEDGESDEPSVVCWTLSPDGDGTRVRLEHRFVETPVVNCIPMPWYFNWRYALRHRLPGLLALLAGGGFVRPPVSYVFEFHAETLSSAEAQGISRKDAKARKVAKPGDESVDEAIDRRIGFRQTAGVK